MIRLQNLRFLLYQQCEGCTDHLVARISVEKTLKSGRCEIITEQGRMQKDLQAGIHVASVAYIFYSLDFVLHEDS